MSEEELNVTRTSEELQYLSEASKKNWWKKPSYIVVLFLIVFTLAPFVYGFANGYFEVSYVKPEDRAYNIKKQSEELRSEIAELSKQKEIMEQKRDRVLEELKKTRTLVEKSKDSFPEVDAHIQVELSACKSCRTPAWIESYRTAFASLEEIEKILSEDKTNESVK